MQVCLVAAVALRGGRHADCRVGLYSVLATAVRQRTAEIGVRMTFGASTRSIFTSSSATACC